MEEDHSDESLQVGLVVVALVVVAARIRCYCYHCSCQSDQRLFDMEVEQPQEPHQAQNPHRSSRSVAVGACACCYQLKMSMTLILCCPSNEEICWWSPHHPPQRRWTMPSLLFRVDGKSMVYLHLLRVQRKLMRPSSFSVKEEIEPFLHECL